MPQRTRVASNSAKDEGRSSRLPPVALVLGAALLAALCVGGALLALLMLRGARGGAQEVVGSALPAGWQPGSGRGVGQVPPPPAGAVPKPVGTVPPVPTASPYEGPPDGVPLPDEAPPGVLAGDAVAAPDWQPPTEPAPPGSFEPPRLIDLPTPQYPALGRRMRREGTVQLQVLVSADGRVLSADPVGERMGMGFEAAARQAAFAARFAPGRRNGEPVEASSRIAIRFRLQ